MSLNAGWQEWNPQLVLKSKVGESLPLSLLELVQGRVCYRSGLSWQWLRTVFVVSLSKDTYRREEPWKHLSWIRTRSDSLGSGVDTLCFQNHFYVLGPGLMFHSP